MVHGEEYETAERYLEEAEAAGRNVDRELGRAYLRDGKLDEAEKRLARRCAAEPKDYDALADLGEVYYLEGRYDGAVEKLQSSVDLYRFRPNVDRTLGRALDKAGKTGAGFYYYGAASELEGNMTVAAGYYKKAMEGLESSDPLYDKAKDRIAELEKDKPRFPVPPGMPGGQRSPLSSPLSPPSPWSAE
jgi:tetratricopeptide (TPR) repeat protein